MKREHGLVLVLLLLAGTLTVGIAVKQPCVNGPWDGRQYTRLCYTDIIPLLGTEQLGENRLPYLDRCEEGGGQCDEYPVLTMYAMRAAAWVSPGSGAGFYYANVAILAGCAVIIALCLYSAVGMRALFFVLAPTLAIYGFMNWDLIAVAFATGATLAYLRRKDGWSGILLGLGAAAKLYPVLLVVPFALGRLRDGKKKEAAWVVGAAAAAWTAVNLPFAAAAPTSWWEFFRFNGARPPDWDSLWFIGCRMATGDGSCLAGKVGSVNAVSALLFVGLCSAVWWLKRWREPGFPRWTFGLPLLILFLLTSKVYSPQYGVWLLPWFALALPDWRLFAVFEAADIAVFASRFLFFADLDGLEGGRPFWQFEVAILVRAAILLACLVVWVLRRREPEPEPVAT